MIRSFREEFWLLLAVLMGIAWVIVTTWYDLSRLVILSGLALLSAAYYFLHYGNSQRAYIEFKKGHNDNALQICKLQMRRFPKDPYPYNLAAQACLRLKDFEGAIEYSTEGIQRAGDFKHLLWVRGEARRNLCLYEKALDDATTAIKYGQKDAGIFILQALALQGLYRYNEAMNILESDQVKNKDKTFVLLLKAYLLDAMNQFDAAYETCKSAFEEISADNLAYGLTIRSIIYSDLGRLDEAIDDADATLEIEPGGDYIYVNRAYFRGRQGDKAGAIEDLETLGSLVTPYTLGHLHSNRARISLLQGHLIDALESTKEAIKVANNPERFLSTHGLMLLRNGIFDEAKRTLDKAIEIDKYNAEAYYFRAELHEKMGNIEEAEKDKKIALDFGYIPYL